MKTEVNLEQIAGEAEDKLKWPPAGSPYQVILAALQQATNQLLQHIAALESDLQTAKERSDTWNNSFHAANAERIQWQQIAERLADGLGDCEHWMHCDCGHPACRRCYTTIDVKDIVAAYQALKAQSETKGK